MFDKVSFYCYFQNLSLNPVVSLISPIPGPDLLQFLPAPDGEASRGSYIPGEFLRLPDDRGTPLFRCFPMPRGLEDRTVRRLNRLGRPEGRAERLPSASESIRRRCGAARRCRRP